MTHTIPTLHAVENSSNITHLGHEGGKLYVRFKSGGLYAYEDVSPRTYDNLKNAESVGKYFHREILGKYPHELIPEKVG